MSKINSKEWKEPLARKGIPYWACLEIKGLGMLLYSILLTCSQWSLGDQAEDRFTLSERHLVDWI